MSKWERIQTIFLYVVFICYIFLLVKILFLSRISIIDLFDSQRSANRSVNLIPFYSIQEYLFSGSADIKRSAFGNVAGNIIAFVPLGVFLPVFRKDRHIKFNFLIIITVTLITEIIQGILGIGAADIDDIIMNCSGGFIGILGYKLLLYLLRNEKKVRVAITIISAFGLPTILYLLFAIQMRF